MKRLVLLLALLGAVPLFAWAGCADDTRAASGSTHDSHRLRELRLRQALENGDISADEAAHWRRRLHRADKYRAPTASDDPWWVDDVPRHYWRDKRRKNHMRD